MVSGVQFDLPFRYKPIKRIGKGGFGMVCSALDTATNRHVAIKRIGLRDSEVDWKRALREMRLMRHFSHENVLMILDVIEPTSKLDIHELYLVIELMDSDLHQILSSSQRLSPDHYQFFMYQTLKALKYIHSAHVIHRDLKPSNIFVNKDCTIKVADFGLARVERTEGGSEAYLTEYVATRWYRAPEVILSWKYYTHAIDMWSVGCIFGEMMLRKPLFAGKDYVHQVQTILRVLGSPTEADIAAVRSDNARNYLISLGYMPPADLRAMFPPETDANALDLLARMLTFNPDHRISVDDALAHPYFADLREPDDEPVCDRYFDFSFESWSLSRPMYAELLWQEVVTFHPEAVANEKLRQDALLAELSALLQSSADPAQLNELLARAASYATLEQACQHCIRSNWISPSSTVPLQSRFLRFLPSISQQ